MSCQLFARSAFKKLFIAEVVNESTSDWVMMIRCSDLVNVSAEGTLSQVLRAEGELIHVALLADTKSSVRLHPLC